MMDNMNANSVHMDGIERQATETRGRRGGGEGGPEEESF